MKQILAEAFIITNLGSICVTKSLEVHKHKVYSNRDNVTYKQGFIWYDDFILFDMLVDANRTYWVKIAVAETLEVDQVIKDNIEEYKYSHIRSLVLPFHLNQGERIFVLGDDDDDTVVSFTLPEGHYQLLFQNRPYTREERESTPRFNCPDLDFADDEDLSDIPDLCLLTFIPTDRKIEPQILDYRRKQLKAPLVLFDEQTP